MAIRKSEPCVPTPPSVALVTAKPVSDVTPGPQDGTALLSLLRNCRGSSPETPAIASAKLLARYHPRWSGNKADKPAGPRTTRPVFLALNRLLFMTERSWTGCKTTDRPFALQARPIRLISYADRVPHIKQHMVSLSPQAAITSTSSEATLCSSCHLGCRARHVEAERLPLGEGARFQDRPVRGRAIGHIIFVPLEAVVLASRVQRAVRRVTALERGGSRPCQDPERVVVDVSCSPSRSHGSHQ